LQVTDPEYFNPEATPITLTPYIVLLCIKKLVFFLYFFKTESIDKIPDPLELKTSAYLEFVYSIAQLAISAFHLPSAREPFLKMSL